MSKKPNNPSDYSELVTRVAQKIFADSRVVEYSLFEKGLTSVAIRVQLDNPNKEIVIKVFDPEKLIAVQKSADIANYCKQFGIPAPYTYGILTEDNVVVMDYVTGCDVSDSWVTLDPTAQSAVLFSMGALLRKIHSLEPIDSWVDQKHHITTTIEWEDWIHQRVVKCTDAARVNVPGRLYEYLAQKGTQLRDKYIKGSAYTIVPMHWDYHFSNISVTGSDVTGVFDFDNAMRGHALADIGQAMYWLALQEKSNFSRTMGVFLFGDMAI